MSASAIADVTAEDSEVQAAVSAYAAAKAEHQKCLCDRYAITFLSEGLEDVKRQMVVIQLDERRGPQGQGNSVR